MLALKCLEAEILAYGNAGVLIYQRVYQVTAQHFTLLALHCTTLHCNDMSVRKTLHYVHKTVQHCTKLFTSANNFSTLHMSAPQTKLTTDWIGNMEL